MSRYIVSPSVRIQSGLGLVELMIGLVVGMIVVGAAMSILTSTLTSSNDSIKMARLDQELRQVMTMVSRDLRRATAWDGAVDVARISLSDPLTLSAVSGSVSVNSSKGNLDSIGIKAKDGTLVFYDGTTLHRGTISSYSSTTETYTVAIDTASPWPADTIILDGVGQGSWTILGPQPDVSVNSNCILFAYDTNADGRITDSSVTSEPNEFFGYRHIDTTSEKSVRTKITSGANCTSSTTGWETLTDSDTVNITTFSVTHSPATVTHQGFTVGVREYKIKITGKLKSDESIVRTLEETIRVRNDKLGAGT